MIIESRLNTYILPSDFVPAGGTVLDLQYNNSNIDISDVPKVITANGAEVYTDGRYGELLSARNFTGTQYDSWVNTVEYDKYTVSGWIKHITNTDELSFLINNDNKLNVADFYGTTAVGITSNVLVIIWDKDNGTTFGGGFLILDAVDAKWAHIAVSLDSINKTVAIKVNNKFYDESNLVGNASVSVDTSRIQPFTVNTVVSGYSPSSPRFPNCNIYNVKVRNYLISNEELKAEFKKYPKI